MRVALVLLALLVAAGPAAAEVRTLAEVRTPDRGGRTAFPVIDAFKGRVVWSDYDAAIDAWRLMAHAGGVTRALPVPPRATPFDVDLGPDGSGGTLAVYSRCARGLRRDFPTPQNQRAARHGCDLFAFSFTTRRETKVFSSRGDEYWPSVWRGRIAFVRGYATRRDPDGTSTPYLYLRGGDGPSRRLRRPSPMITERLSSSSGSYTDRFRVSTMIEGLDLRRRTVAYTWTRNEDFDGSSFIYTATAGRELRPAARGASAGGGAAVSIRALGAPSLSRGRVKWLFTNRGEPEYFAVFARRGQASARTKAVAFAHDGAAAYFIDGGVAAEFEPTAQPGGTFALKVDDAVTYSRMPRGWQPVRPPALD